MIRRALLGVLVVGWASVPLLQPAAADARAHRSTGDTSTSTASAADTGGVQLRVLNVAPSAPPRSETKRPLVVTLELTNTTGAAISGIRITGRRGAPLETQSAYDAVLADKTPEPDGEEIRPTHSVSIDLPADGSAHRVLFRTTYGVPTDSGVCQCGDGVYPLYFTAERVTSAGASKRLDVATTMLPSFLSTPKPARVSWVWPLIDRPHRLTSDTVFSDDALATDAAEGGRLDRSLRTVELAAARGIPLTLVADPELIDELEVMSTGRYTVAPGSGTPASRGTGQLAAQDWLSRFTQLLETHPGVRITFTPYADPDITSLSTYGLGWRTAMPTAMATRVRQALAGRPLDYSLAWPNGGAYTGKAFTALAKAGVQAALLPTTAVTPRDGADGGTAAGTARLSAGGTAVAAGLLTPALQSDVSATVTASTSNNSHLQQLLGEIAVRTAAQPKASHTVVLTPSRYVDPDPAQAVRTMVATSDSPFARRMPLIDALSESRLPDTRSKLAAFPSSTATLPSHVIQSASDVTSYLPVIQSMLAGGGAAATTVVASLPVALQRTESSYWVAHPSIGAAFAATLVRRKDSLVNGVSIVKPTSGVYTLASKNSPLPVTVDNSLPYPVRIRVRVTTDNGLPGFTARDLGPQRIDANARRTLHLPTSITRPGRIQIEAQLLTPNGRVVNQPVSLSVHSTVFGVVGIVITAVAGAVLALALLVRLVRRLLARRRPAHEPVPTDRTPAPEPAT